MKNGRVIDQQRAALRARTALAARQFVNFPLEFQIPYRNLLRRHPAPPHVPGKETIP
jgi:hypothetical protein